MKDRLSDCRGALRAVKRDGREEAVGKWQKLRSRDSRLWEEERRLLRRWMVLVSKVWWERPRVLRDSSVWRELIREFKDFKLRVLPVKTKVSMFLKIKK